MIGKRLRQLRNTTGMSQQEFADSLGLPQTTYSNYERDVADPPFDVLTKIGRLYDVDMNWLLDFTKTNFNDAIGIEYDDFADLVSMGFAKDEAYRITQDEFNRYGDMIMALNYDNRKKVVNFVESLKKGEE